MPFQSVAALIYRKSCDPRFHPRLHLVPVENVFGGLEPQKHLQAGYHIAADKVFYHLFYRGKARASGYDFEVGAK